MFRHKVAYNGHKSREDSSCYRFRFIGNKSYALGSLCQPAKEIPKPQEPLTKPLALLGLSTVPGFTFLPPINNAEHPATELESEVKLVIEIFKVTEGQPSGEPIGPSFSNKTGIITLEDDHYHANWQTSDSAQANETLRLFADSVFSGQATSRSLGQKAIIA